jgi:hypothetical protein
VGTLVRLYIGWRLLRLLRPLLVVAVIGAGVLALHSGRVAAKGSASSPLVRGAVAAQLGLSRAFERAFVPSQR